MVERALKITKLREQIDLSKPRSMTPERARSVLSELVKTLERFDISTLMKERLCPKEEVNLGERVVCHGDLGEGLRSPKVEPLTRPPDPRREISEVA